MTMDNDTNDILAKSKGFEVVDHPRGRDHAHSVYKKGILRIWRISSFRDDGCQWQTAHLINGGLVNHKPMPDLEQSLARELEP